MIFHHPKGSRLPALESNLLKYRALEMVMIIFHVESLKKFVLHSIQASDRFCEQDKLRIPINVNKIYEMAWAALVADKIITQSESNDIQRIIDYRNDIGHRIHLLTCDISNNSFARSISQMDNVKYDYDALKRLKTYREKIGRGFQSKYIISFSYDGFVFEAAERAYQQELRRLKSKITRQIDKRNEEIQKLNTEISLKDIGLLGLDAVPRKAANGTLTKRGIEICNSLFDQKKSTWAVANLMDISYRAAANRRRAWEIKMRSRGG